jgi:quercetin dioxygenase-like cupin family protein
MQPPDITRVFKGPGMEFEVEIVFANDGNQSPEEGHDYDEIVLVAQGAISLKRDDRDQEQALGKYDTTVLPAGTVHRISVVEAPARVVIVHPERQ